MGTKRYDVAILGTGIGGGILGTILAKKKLRVLMIEAGLHPRFAVGESTIPMTSAMAKLMAIHFDVPELMCLSCHNAMAEQASTNCGIKKGFGFVYHRPGQSHNRGETVQTYLSHPEIHLFRQDIDAYFAYAAVKYGADLRQSTRIEHIDIRRDGVYLQAQGGEQFECDYLVDGAGYRSPLAIKSGFRQTPPRFGTHSRTLFTHMINVPMYDEVHPYTRDQVPLPWGQTTLHHLFDRGWLWVIPFNNVVGSKNPLCSVGLTLDPRVHPSPNGQAPAEEFDEFIRRYPSIAAQFKDARAVRPWVASGERLQYSAGGTVGDRFCLLPHSHGFVDALYSKGLAVTTSVVAPLAQKILDAKQQQDYSAKFFQYIHDLTTALYDCNDALVEGSFLSFKDFDLFNSWWRIWLGVADWKFAELMAAYEKNQDPQYLPWTGGTVGWSCREPENRMTTEFFDSVFHAIKAHDRGELSKSETLDLIMEKVRRWNKPQDLGNWDQHVHAPEGDSPSHHPDYPLSLAN